MTQAEMQNHPFWQLFTRRLTPVISSCQQRGMISPNEVGLLSQLLKNSYPQMHAFVENLVQRYGQMSDSQMDNEVYNWLQAPIQQCRMRIQQMSGGFGNGFGSAPWNNGGVVPWGGGGGCAPRGFGFDSFSGAGRGIPSSPFGGGAPANRPNGADPFTAPPTGAGPSVFGGGTKQPTEREKYVESQMTPDKAKPANKIPWKTPTVIDTNTVSLNGEVELTVSKLEMFDGSFAREALVYDPRVEYVSDADVLEKYKPLFSIFPESQRQVLTVCYQKLKVIHAPQEEILKLSQAISASAGKMSGAEAKLRAVIATASHFNKRAYEEFANLFLDELEAHMQCGELCDSAHPKNILNRPSKLEHVLAIVSGDISKEMSNALDSMKGFRERLEKLLEVLIEEFATGLHRRIINVKTDPTALSGFYRALPGVWTEDCGITLKNSVDLVNLFLATREKMDGSVTANAVAADSNLKKKLDELANEYTLIFVPRIATWCNYSKADVCSYDQKGNCQPSCFSRLQPRNDVEYFTNKLLESWSIARDTILKWSPKNLYMEIDEETFCLQYGRTTDESTWVGTCKYWH